MAGIFSRFFGSSVSVAAGVAIGGSVQNSLNPLTQALANETWSLHPDVPPDAVLLAIGVAQGQVPEAEASTWAAQLGYGGPQFAAMMAIADTGPGVAQAFDLWRRGTIDEAGFRRAAKREALEQEWIDALVQLKRRLLSPAELANAVVQGFRSEAAAAADAALQGYDAADFQTMVDVTGLPPGPETLVEWERRGIISRAELEQGIREGHTKIKYIPFYEAALQRILSAQEWATAHLKGHATQAEMYAGGAAQGYSQADMDLFYLDRGRPATAHQIHIGFARGAKVDGQALNELDAIAAAVRQSDIRPEYTSLIQAGRFTYPSAFVVRGLTQSGAFTQATAEKVLVEAGWVPEYARLAAASFATGAAAKTSGETKSELADEYELGFIDEAEYRTHLTALGITGHEQDLEVLHAEASAIKSARTAAVTKVRNMYEKGDSTQEIFAGQLAALGMHDLAVQREVQYANIVKGV